MSGVKRWGAPFHGDPKDGPRLIEVVSCLATLPPTHPAKFAGKLSSRHPAARLFVHASALAHSNDSAERGILNGNPEHKQWLG
jgi:hypothetical protein